MAELDDSNNDHMHTSIIEIARHKEAGYKISLFINQNKVIRYQCGLCMQVCCDAVELSCSACNEEDSDDDDDKQYCQSCLRTYLNENNFTCPANKDHKNALYTGVQYIRGKVNNLSMYCPTSNHDHDNIDDAEGAPTKGQNYDEKKQDKKDSCLWKDKLHKLFYHLNSECKFFEKPIKCEFSKYGCKFIACSTLLQKHNEQNMSTHLKLVCNIVDELKSENKKLWKVIPELTSEMLQVAKPSERKRLIGERLFPKIELVEPILAGKITGMLLELDNTELLVLLSQPLTLMNKITEAMHVLKECQQKQLQSNPGSAQN